MTPTHQLVGDDIKFRQLECAYCGVVTVTRWFPWNSPEVVRGWVCLPCFHTETPGNDPGLTYRAWDPPSVFVEPYDIEAHGHIGQFHSDVLRRTHCHCSCGWTLTCQGAERSLDVWREHVDGVTFRRGREDSKPLHHGGHNESSSGMEVPE